MKQKTLITAATSTLVATLAVAGITYAATPAGNNTSLLNQGTVEVDSIKVGSTGSGGVTFFNGTIVNEGTQTPVTFGDDVRVDGRIWRGENQGPALGDNKPFIINDDTQVAGSFTVGGTDIFAAIDAKADKSLVTTNTTNISSNDTDIAANTTAISNNASNISSKANTADVYTQSQIDATNTAQDLVIQSKANSADVVTKANPEWNTRTGAIQVNGAAFMPDDIDANGGAALTNYSNLGFVNLTAASQSYFAPVHLPHGVTVTEVTMMAVDNDASDISFFFVSNPFIADSVTNVNTGNISHATIASSGASADYTLLSDTTIDTPIVDNDNRFYSLFVTLPAGTADQIFGSARIEYEYTSPH